MKIYFAYRSPYIPNNRFLKEFEANSILDFFQKNWQQLSSDNYEHFLGVDVYGFPIGYNENNDNKSEIPMFFDELAEQLSKGSVYCNEMLGNEHLLQVHIDDDEIELAWYVFDEIYKNENWDKLAIWFTPKLPTIIEKTNKKFIPNGFETSNYLGHRKLPYFYYSNKWGWKFNRLQVADNANENCYLMSSAVYDGGNLQAMQFIQLHGTNMQNLINDLKRLNFDVVKDYYREFKNSEHHDYLPNGLDELHTLKMLANQFDLHDLSTVIHKLNDYPLLIESGFLEHTNLQNRTVSQASEKSLINIHEHIAELSIFDGYCFNYYILFDETWATTYPDLAKSIQNFGTNWRFVGSSERDINDYTNQYRLNK